MYQSVSLMINQNMTWKDKHESKTDLSRASPLKQIKILYIVKSKSIFQETRLKNVKPLNSSFSC